jgi:phospholipid transport system substrate-binding protein
MSRAASTLLVAVGLLVGAAVAGDAEIDASNPSRLIESAATAILQDLDAHRAEYRKDPAKLEVVVTRILLPHFDTDYSAQLVLGRHWTNATAEQRRRFVEGFYHSLLRNYSSALADFKSNQLKVLPFTGDAAAVSATVRSQVRRSNGENVAVNYTLRRVNGEWKAWDVVIEGISYVKSFRDDYGSAVDRDGLDALILRLEAQAAGKTAATAKKNKA